MSIDNCGLEDMVEKTLESTGVLSKMRAELRANVFHVLEKGSSFQNKLYTDKINDLLSIPNGSLLLSLVKDLFEYLELTFTESVFNSETGVGNHYQYKNKDDIFNELPLRKDDKRPLLLQILEVYQSHSQSNNKNSVITQNGKVNNEMCKESHLIQNFNNEAESSKSINDTKPKNLSPIKTKLFDHNVQLDKHDNSRSSISLHSNLSNLQLKEIDSSDSLNSSSIEQLLPNKEPSSIEQNDNTDEDINSDLKSNKNDTSLEEVETEENISCGDNSISSIDLSTPNGSPEIIKTRSMQL